MIRRAVCLPLGEGEVYSNSTPITAFCHEVAAVTAARIWLTSRSSKLHDDRANELVVCIRGCAMRKIRGKTDAETEEKRMPIGMLIR